MSKSKNKQLNIFPIPYHWAFVIIGFIFGLQFVYVNPPFHSNDEDRHFLKAYHLVNDGFVPDINAERNKIGGEIPQNLLAVIQSFQGVPYFQGKKLNKPRVEQLAGIPLNENNLIFNYNTGYYSNPLPFLVFSPGIMVSKTSNPVDIGYNARISGLIFYLILMFFVIRIAPVWKSVFFLYGLTPMVLYQCTSVTYDTMQFGLGFLIFSMFLHYYFDKDARIGLKELILLVFIIFLFTSIKRGYFFIPFVFFLLPTNKFSEKPLIFRLILVAIILLLIKDTSSIWKFVTDSVTKDLQITPFKMQTDFYKNVGLRVDEIFADIPNFIRIMYENILHFRQEWISGINGRFGYSYSVMSNEFYIVNSFMLILVATLDNNGKFSITPLIKYTIFIIGFVTMFILVLGFFLMQTPVGGEMTFGFQGRYFVPAIPLFLFVLFNNKINIPNWEKYGSLVVIIYTIIMLAYTVGELDKIFYEF